MVGRKKLDYETIEIRKTVPKEIHERCMILLHEEIYKYKKGEIQKKNIFSASC